MLPSLKDLEEIERRIGGFVVAGAPELGVALIEALGICSYKPDEGDPTESTDAAIWLWNHVTTKVVKRRFNFPWSYRLGNLPISGESFALVGTSKREHIARTPALALCLGMVRVLISEHDRPNDAAN